MSLSHVTFPWPAPCSPCRHHAACRLPATHVAPPARPSISMPQAKPGRSTRHATPTQQTYDPVSLLPSLLRFTTPCPARSRSQRFPSVRLKQGRCPLPIQSIHPHPSLCHPTPCLHAPVCLPPLFLHYRPCLLIPCPAPMRLLATHLPCLVLCLPASHAVPIPPLQMSANLFLRPLSCPFCSPFLVSDDQHDPIACVTETPPVVE